MAKQGGQMFFLKRKLFFLLFFFSSFLKGGELYLEVSNEDMGALGSIPRAFKQNKEISDGNYTQGVYFSYSFSPGKQKKLTFSLAQDLFTPSGDNKVLAKPSNGVRPFASYSLIGGDFYLRQENFLHNVGLYLGLLGPASFGGQMQNFFHKTFKKKEGYPGWDDQVGSEALASLEYSVAYRKSLFCRYLCIEGSPSVSVSVGNLVRRVAIGGSLRVGKRLPEDYVLTAHKFLSRGPYLRDGKTFFWNLFVGVYLVDVYYNALLDKATELSKKVFVKRKSQMTEFSFGGDLAFSRFLMRLAFVMRSAEYEGHKPYEFVRLGLGYKI